MFADESNNAHQVTIALQEIAFDAERDGRTEVYVSDVVDLAVQPGEGPGSIKWSPD